MAEGTGMRICEEYFREVGAPMIEQKFPEYKDRIAAGLVGSGSECFGFDDECSRDHDWGPSFCLWLNKEDYKAIGRSLQAEVEKLPQGWKEFGPREVSKWGGGRVGVFEIGQFYKDFTGLDHPPVGINEWRPLLEHYLAACTNGKVFCDPLGEFSRFRSKLKDFYPEDVRLKKIAARCMTAAQQGQYNFMRAVERGEYVAALHAESQFCQDIISLVFLLNKEYTPFYKWRHKAVKNLPILGDFTYGILLKMVTTHKEERGESLYVLYGKKNHLIEETCQNVIEELRRQGLSDSSSSFLLDHGPILQQRIKDAVLRNSTVWLD